MCAQQQQHDDMDTTELAEVFHLVDRSGTGVLDWVELRRCLRGLGFPVSKKEVRDLVRATCPLEGFIKLKHFYEIVDELGSERRDALRELKHGFHLFTEGRARAKYITEDDLRRATMSAQLTADIPRMISVADLDGDGKVNQRDFIHVMSKVCAWLLVGVHKPRGLLPRVYACLCLRSNVCHVCVTYDVYCVFVLASHMCVVCVVSMCLP